jgi:transcriptional regulator GlxA family with amidase domain
MPIALDTPRETAPAAPERAFAVGIIFTPGFSLMAYSATVEPLRGANMVAGSELYRWKHYSPDGGSIVSGGGLEVITEPLPKLAQETLDMVIVCGGITSHIYRHAGLAAFLRQALHRSIVVGSTSTATFILAAAGLLESRRCTVHYDYADGFREAFPDIALSRELFIIDRGVFTCAGGISAMDVILRYIAERNGSGLAEKVSNVFIYGGSREPSAAPESTLRARLGISQPALLRALDAMEAAIEQPLRTSELARIAGVSTRQLERLFTRHVGCSPSQHYIRVRLERARKLLRGTRMSVLEVALACGFTSASHFARAYRARHHIVPRSDRLPPSTSLAASARKTDLPARDALTNHEELVGDDRKQRGKAGADEQRIGVHPGDAL